jgi:hypothetical protein
LHKNKNNSFGIASSQSISSGNDNSGASFLTAKRSITDNSPKIDDLLEGSSNKKNI